MKTEYKPTDQDREQFTLLAKMLMISVETMKFPREVGLVACAAMMTWLDGLTDGRLGDVAELVPLDDETERIASDIEEKARAQVFAIDNDPGTNPNN